MSEEKATNPSQMLASKESFLRGKRLKEVRIRAGLTIREVARNVGIDKNTLLALEAGKRVRESTLTRVFNFYGVLPVMEPIVAESRSEGAHFAKNEIQPEHWYRLFLDNVEEPSEVSTAEAIRDPAVRKRLGRQGLASQFFKRLPCNLTQGRLKAAIFEVYGPSGWSQQPSGEAFIYCLQGSLRFHIGEESFILTPGESATINRTVRHMHELNEAHGDGPAIFLYVQCD